MICFRMNVIKVHIIYVAIMDLLMKYWKKKYLGDIKHVLKFIEILKKEYGEDIKLDLTIKQAA